ncbi:MAG TPA: helix-turn-helix domain-containing protein [Lacipirellulaceae bacterium]|nr:helix-turn-helix domain-containing protein [Lacipirellulaceae bacterium]
MATKKVRRNSKKNVGCPVETTLGAIGGQWKVMVLHYLMNETMRFGELSRALRGISPRTLTKQLRELESDGVIRREVHQQIPPKVEYSLSRIGRKLKPVLMAMHDWGLELERTRARKE